MAEPATIGGRACNHMWLSLQPYVMGSSGVARLDRVAAAADVAGPPRPFRREPRAPMQRPLDTTHTVTCVSPLALGVAVSSFFSLTPSPSPSPSPSPNLYQVSVGPGISLRCVGHAPTRRSVLPPLGAMDACALPMCGAYGRCVLWRLIIAALAFLADLYRMSILSHVYSKPFLLDSISILFDPGPGPRAVRWCRRGWHARSGPPRRSVARVALVPCTRCVPDV